MAPPLRSRHVLAACLSLASVAAWAQAALPVGPGPLADAREAAPSSGPVFVAVPEAPASRLNVEAHALWAFGAQVSYAELAANQDLPPSQVALALSRAVQAATQTGCIPAATLAAIEELRDQVAGAPRSRPFHSAILALRGQLPPIITASCSCGAEGRSGGPPAGTPPSPPGPASPTLANGGAGSRFDANTYRGKYFEGGAAGTITQICVYGREAGTRVVVAVKAEPDGAPESFRVTVPITADQAWSCADVSRRWSASTLFLYKVDGDGAVGYESGPPTDSWYSGSRGTGWARDSWRRGYTVSISR